jgi:hypothetical protein
MSMARSSSAADLITPAPGSPPNAPGEEGPWQRIGPTVRAAPAFALCGWGKSEEGAL